MFVGRFTRRQLLARLTARELDVLQEIGTGDSNKEIAATLGIGINTVKNHVSFICAKLGARNRVDALRIAGRIHEKSRRMS